MLSELNLWQKLDLTLSQSQNTCPCIDTEVVSLFWLWYTALHKTLGYRHDAYLFGGSVCPAGVLYFFCNLNSVFCMVVLVYSPMYSELSFFPLKTDIDLKHSVDEAFNLHAFSYLCLPSAEFTAMLYDTSKSYYSFLPTFVIHCFVKSPHLIGGGILYED